MLLSYSYHILGVPQFGSLQAIPLNLDALGSATPESDRVADLRLAPLRSPRLKVAA